MDARAKSFTLILCLGLLFWLHYDTKNALVINYEWHTHLINHTTGHTIEPRESYDLAKVIEITDDYLNSTNAIERLYDLEHETNMENPFVPDQVYSNALDLVQSGLPVSNQTKCGKDLKWISDQLTKHRDYQLIKGKLGLELTKFMDSYGRPEAGFYSGLVTWQGSYKGCMGASLNEGSIRARYCTAKMRPKWWPKNETAHPKTRVRVGICLPESCDTMSFKRQKQAIDFLIKFDLSQFYRDNLEFDSMFCLPDERSPIRQIPLRGRIFIWVVTAWLALIVIASIAYELIRRKQRKRAKESMLIKFKQDFWEKGLTVNGFLGRGVYDPNQRAKSKELRQQSPVEPLGEKKTFGFELLEVLSIHRTFKDFKSNVYVEQLANRRMDHDTKVRVNFCWLNSIKFMMAIAIVFGHSCYLNSAFFRTLANRVEMNTARAAMLIFSLSKCVDTFFIIFGVLTAYTILRKFKVQQLSNPMVWLGINAGIMVRLSPLFMLIYWYSKLISPYTGEGPWWDYGVHKFSMKGNCVNEPWYTSILYFGRAGLLPASSCVLPAWFLVCYSQIALIIPVIVYILYKLPNHITKYLLVAFAMVISVIQVALKMYQQKSIRIEAFSIYGAFLVNIIEKFESTGTMSTLGRVGTVVAGCYAGYLLRMYEIGEIREWPKWFRSRLSLIIVFVLHVVIILLPYVGHFFIEDGHRVSLNEFILAYTFMTILWPVLNAALIIHATTIHNRTAIVRFLSHSFWHSANKLGYCIYLIHWEVMFVGLTGYEYAQPMGFPSDIARTWAYGVFYSVVFALFIHLMFEAPIASLFTLIMRQTQKKFTSSSEVIDGDDKKRLDCIGTPNLSIR